MSDKTKNTLILEATINVKNYLMSELKEKEVKNRNLLVKKFEMIGEAPSVQSEISINTFPKKVLLMNKENESKNMLSSSVYSRMDPEVKVFPSDKEILLLSNNDKDASNDTDEMGNFGVKFNRSLDSPIDTVDIVKDIDVSSKRIEKDKCNVVTSNSVPN